MWNRRFQIPTTVLALVLLAGCGDDGTGPGDDEPVPTAMTVSADTLEFGAIGDTLTLTATVTDQDGDPIADASVDWTSSAPTVAEVDASGRVVSVGEGEADITASSGTLSATAVATVAQAPAAVEVSPAADTLVEGESAQLTATVFDANGVEIPGAAVAWASSDEASATVDASGLVTAGRGGFTVEITAEADGATGSALIRVLGQILFETVSADGDYEVYVANADGSGLANRTNDAANDRYPAWSPDGEKFAFDSDRDGDVDIYVATADGGTVYQINDVAGSDWGFVWPPLDLVGTRDPLFVSTRDGDADIYSMQLDIDGTSAGATKLTNNTAADHMPKWSPDGDLIGFNSDRDGDHEIYVMTPDGSSGTNLTSNDVNDRWPDWSPDGSQIAFASNRDGNYDIFVMNADGSGQTKLTEDSAFDGFPTWSPDGTRIAFRSDRTGDGDIYIMDADGTDVVQVIAGARRQSYPVWRPRP